MPEKYSNIPILDENTKWETIDDSTCYLHNEKLNSYAYMSISALQVIEQIDGVKSVKQITDVVTENQSTAEDYHVIYNFINQDLHKSGFLVDGENKKRDSNIKFSYVIISERLTNGISKHFLFLFNKSIIISFYFISLIISSLIVFFNKFQFNTDSHKINYLALILATVGLLLFHELGHCTALKKFNQSSKGIGIGFYFFTPVLYADVTSAWKLKNKERVVVDLGGFYFQSIVTFIYLIIGCFFENSTFLSVICFSFFLMFFNMNPFIKSDTYWAISDWFNFLDLYKKSNEEIINFIYSPKKSNKNIFLIIFGILRYLFILSAVLLIIYFFHKSVVDVLSENFHLDFWNIEKFILISVSMFFILFEVKNAILAIRKITRR